MMGKQSFYPFQKPLLSSSFSILGEKPAKNWSGPPYASNNAILTLECRWKILLYSTAVPSDFIWDFGKLPFPEQLGKYFFKIGKISAKKHEIGKIKAMFGLGMTPI